MQGVPNVPADWSDISIKQKPSQLNYTQDYGKQNILSYSKHVLLKELTDHVIHFEFQRDGYLFNCLILYKDPHLCLIS